MRKTLGYFLKAYGKILILPILVSLTLLVFCSVRTNKCLILKGDTEVFTAVVDVDSDYEIKGSFSTIYVQDMNRSTLFQNFIASHMKTMESYELSSYESHITSSESYKAGKIQYYSSITNALVLAYHEASKVDSKIHLEYTFSGFDVTYYAKGSVLQIQDRIIGVTLSSRGGVYEDISNEMNFREAINSEINVGDTFRVIRDGSERDLVLDSEASLSFGAYSIYTIDQEKTTPGYTLKDNMIGGPSGGLLQTLSIYNQLVEEDITHGLKIAGTGTISYTGRVGTIGGIREKIPTAFDDHIDIFFCAAGNYEDAYDAWQSIAGHERMRLVRIETFYDALEYLTEGYKNDFGSNI